MRTLRIFLTVLWLTGLFALSVPGRVLAQEVSMAPGGATTEKAAEKKEDEKTPATTPDSVKAPEEKKIEATAPPAAKSAPVIVNGKTLFTVYGTESNPATHRAEDIARRIARVAQDPPVLLQGLTTQENDGWTDIVQDGEVVASISETDGKEAGRTSKGLAEEVIERIQKELTPRQKFGWREAGQGILYTLLSTLVLVLMLRLLWYLQGRVQALLERWRGEKLRAVRIQHLELLSVERISGFLLLLLRIASAALALTFLAIYISTVFGFFPQTQGYASVLWGYTLAPFGVIGSTFLSQIPNIIFMAVILLLAYYANRLLQLIFTEIGEGKLQLPGFYAEWTNPTLRLARVLLFAITLVAIFPYIPGATSPAFQGISLFLGFLLSMASSGAISNIISGLMLTYTRAFNIGDRVKIGEVVGVVTETTMLVTRIRTDENVNVAIPNSTVLSANVFNFTLREETHTLEVKVKVSVGYDTPWREIEKMLLEAADCTEGLPVDSPPSVKLEAFSDTSIAYELSVNITDPNRESSIQSELYKNILDVFSAHNVSLVSLYLRTPLPVTATVVRS